MPAVCLPGGCQVPGVPGGLHPGELSLQRECHRMASVLSVTSVRLHTACLISSWGGIGGQAGFTPSRWPPSRAGSTQTPLLCALAALGRLLLRRRVSHITHLSQSCCVHSTALHPPLPPTSSFLMLAAPDQGLRQGRHAPCSRACHPAGLVAWMEGPVPWLGLGRPQAGQPSEAPPLSHMAGLAAGWHGGGSSVCVGSFQSSGAAPRSRQGSLLWVPERTR